ncbi:MAG: cupin domain-containing protein [Polyangiales bacterium]
MPASSLPVDELVARLDLAPHPEGGYFRETYRAGLVVPESALPSTFRGPRAASTSIYFLLPRGTFSALHRIASDEVWHFYAGGALTVHCLSEDGKHERLLLGRDLVRGEVPQAVVRAGTWFGARVEGEGEFALVGCTVAPGFDFADFEMGTRDELLSRFPAQATLVRELTRS